MIGGQGNLQYLVRKKSRTGPVHTALGHSQEDFLINMKYKLLVLFLVDDNGKFTKETR